MVALALAPAAGAYGVEAAGQGAGFWTATRVRQALANPAPPTAGPSSGATLGTERGRVRSIGERPPRAGILGAAARSSSSSIRVSEPSAVANRTNGRIFGLDPVQGPYSCSGTSLATPSGSIVLTAGHCVYEDGQWGRDLVFVPGFDHERRPFGTFVASAIYTTSQWQASENSDFDVAALRVGPGVAGTLSQAVGARGWTSGSSRYLPMQIFGYPAGALDGMELRACAAEGLGSDPRSYGEAGPPPLPAHCDMADGSSGGAWMAGELIDGVTSYGYPAQPDRLYSPYFGASIGKFLSSLP